MPPEQDDHRARQIEAMRRYFANLGTKPARPAGKPGRQRPATGSRPLPSWPWLLLTTVLVVAGLIGGILIGTARGAGQPARAETSSGSAGVATSRRLAVPVATPACKTAVDRANRSLAIAERVQKALGGYTQIMDDLRNGRIDGREAVKQATPSLTVGSIASAQFANALADYQKVVDQCRLQAP